MLDEEIIKERLDGIISDCVLLIDDEEINLNDRFYEDLGADSIDFVEIIMATEEEYEIEIPDKDMDSITTVQELLNYIKENI